MLFHLLPAIMRDLTFPVGSFLIKLDNKAFASRTFFSVSYSSSTANHENNLSFNPWNLQFFSSTTGISVEI